jgi:hypothetical protein
MHEKRKFIILQLYLNSILVENIFLNSYLLIPNNKIALSDENEHLVILDKI